MHELSTSLLILVVILVTGNILLVWFLFSYFRKPVSQSLLQFLSSDIMKWRYDQARQGSGELEQLDNEIRSFKKELVQKEIARDLARQNENAEFQEKIYGEAERELQELETERQVVADTLYREVEQAVSQLMSEIKPRIGGENSAASNTLFLEYTTVIVLITSVIVLAVVGILNGDQLSPILASIAGYVLGRASREREILPV